MQVQELPIKQVKPYPNNPRRISAKAIEAVALSISKYGWKQPIVVDKDHVVIVGHTRLKAAESLSLEKVPVVVAEDLDAEKVAEYRLVDNKAGEISQWEDDLLDMELTKIDLGELAFLFEDDDLSEFDFDDLEPEEKESQGLADTILQYNIVFDDMDQQEIFHHWLRALKETYPDEETIAARIIKFLEEA